MNILRNIAILTIVMGCVAPAAAQYGLYGAPDMVPLQQGPAVGPYNTYAMPPAYPAVASVPPVQRAPAMPAYGSYTPAPSVPAPAPAPSVVEQMLNESVAYEQATPDRLAGPPSDAPQHGAACDPQYGTPCGAPCVSNSLAPSVCGTCGQFLPTCSPWYASGKVLVLGRNLPNKLWTTYESPPPQTNEANQIPTQFDFEWKWGGEIRFGRKFCFGSEPYALEATYWSVGAFEGAVTRSMPGGVSTTLTVGNVNFDGNPDPVNGAGGTLWFDNALEHRVWRHSEVHNVELNLIHFGQTGVCASGWSADWSAGIRYLRFKDDLLFSTEANPVNLPDPNLDPNAFLDEQITNSLMGAQLGCDLSYAFSPTWRFFLTPKLGIYNNHIRQYFLAGLSDGTIAVPNADSGQTGTYPVRSSTDVLSFLTQLDLGVQWQFNPNWTVEGGYRVVVATGMGLADDQIPNPVVAIDELADIDHNATLILHGAFVGMTYNY